MNKYIEFSCNTCYRFDTTKCSTQNIVICCKTCYKFDTTKCKYKDNMYIYNTPNKDRCGEWSCNNLDNNNFGIKNIIRSK